MMIHGSLVVSGSGRGASDYVSHYKGVHFSLKSSVKSADYPSMSYECVTNLIGGGSDGRGNYGAGGVRGVVLRYALLFGFGSRLGFGVYVSDYESDGGWLWPTSLWGGGVVFKVEGFMTSRGCGGSKPLIILGGFIVSTVAELQAQVAKLDESIEAFEVEVAKLDLPVATMVDKWPEGLPVQATAHDIGKVARADYSSIDSVSNRAGLVEIVKRLDSKPAELRKHYRVHFSARVTMPLDLTVEDFMALVNARVEGDSGQRGFDGSATVYEPKPLGSLLKAIAEKAFVERQIAQVEAASGSGSVSDVGGSDD